MVTKKYIKFVQSLHRKKYRQKYGQFTVEGEKSVLELLRSDFKISEINATQSWLNEHGELLRNVAVQPATDADLERMSFFKTPSPVIAVAEQRKTSTINRDQNWILALDGIRDPGNLGTIIRIADWYGIQQVICSIDTVDLHNPKTISSTMGSFTRVDVLYTDLSRELESLNKTLFFALMDGTPAHELSHTEGGVLVIGNEANGISDELMSVAHEAITIPRIGQAESLNAAIATGILCERLVR